MKRRLQNHQLVQSFQATRESLTQRSQWQCRLCSGGTPPGGKRTQAAGCRIRTTKKELKSCSNSPSLAGHRNHVLAYFWVGGANQIQDRIDEISLHINLLLADRIFRNGRPTRQFTRENFGCCLKFDIYKCVAGISAGKSSWTPKVDRTCPPNVSSPHTIVTNFLLFL